MDQQREGYNGYDGEQLKGYLDEIAHHDNELLDLKIDYMNRCRGPRAQIREIMATAKEAGVNMKAFRERARNMREDNARERRIAKLEADDLQDYEAMCEALGDYGSTPLGEAALKRAKQNEQVLDGLA